MQRVPQPISVVVCGVCCSSSFNHPRVFSLFSLARNISLGHISFCLFLSKCLTVLGSLAVAIFCFVCFVFLSYKYFPWCHSDLLNSLHVSSFILGRQSSQTSSCSPFPLQTKYWVNRSILPTATHCSSVTFTMSYLLSIFSEDFPRCHK